MSLLLDTQVLLWYLLDDPRLSDIARDRVQNANDAVLVSPASLWEIGIKISLGKYTLPAPFVEFWNSQLRENDFSLLPLSISHLGFVADLPFHHRDPFDRLIIAQSKVEGIPVASNDSVFDRYGVTRVW